MGWRKRLAAGYAVLAWWWPVAAQQGAFSPIEERTNIILIIADDLGKYDLSVYGGQLVQTPHIDNLAHSGAYFEQGYATAGICSPSRMALLSGQYQQRYGYDFQPHQRYPRNGLQRWIARRLMAPDGWIPEQHTAPVPTKTQARRHGLPAEAFTLAERLQAQGYRTGLFGKWHLGYSPQHHPLQHGFHTFYGFLEAYSLYVPRRHDPRVVNAKAGIFADKIQWKKRRGARRILRGHSPVKENRYLTDAITEEGLTFIQQTSERSPFLAVFSFSAPHAPWQAPRRLYDQLSHIQDHHQRVYAAMILALDEAVGRIVGHLKANGLEERTLVLFTSDNGTATYTGHLSAAPLKGGKLSMFEGGIAVPIIVSWPGHIAPGQKLERISSHLDLSATIVAAAGADTADRLDGQNLLPMLAGKAQPIPAQTLFWRAGYNQAIRQEQYKAVLDESTGAVFLYDLAQDPGEQIDLYPSAPPQLRNTLLDELQRWKAQLPPPAWPHVINYRMEAHGSIIFFGT